MGDCIAHDDASCAPATTGVWFLQVAVAYNPGGGYSDGNCGDLSSTWAGCGGGGSFNSGTNQDNTAGARSGAGQVIITW